MPRKSKASINWDGLKKGAGNIFGIGFWVALMSVPVLMIRGCVKDSNAAGLLKQTRTGEVNGVTYKLSDAHQVITYEGKTVFYLNFRSTSVNIDGDDEADGIKMFSDFKHTSMIKDARAAGLEIADDILEVSETMDEGDKKRVEEDFEDMIEDARIFRAIYGDKIEETPKKQDVKPETLPAAVPTAPTP